MFILSRKALSVCRSAPLLSDNGALGSKSHLKHCRPSVLLKEHTVKRLLCRALNEPQTDASHGPHTLEEVTEGDPELEHKLKVIMLETEVLRQDGKMVPPEDFFTPKTWQNLLTLPSRSGRTKYLEYLFKTAKAKEHRQAKKTERLKAVEAVRALRPATKATSVEEHAQTYGLAGNNIFLRFYDTSMNHFYNGRLVKAMQFGQKLVIDCGYDRNMSRRENQNAAKQLMLLFAENRIHNDPFDLYFTNMRRESELTQMVHKSIPTMYDREFPINVHETSYLDLLPKSQLVYLTPHCREEMEGFDHDAIYIIGGIVDKLNNEPLSLAKAKREGLQMRKFPLDRYLQWGSGSGKSLTLNQCVAILLDLKATGDWRHALRHVPRRKLADLGQLQATPQRAANWRPAGPRPRLPSIRSLFDD